LSHRHCLIATEFKESVVLFTVDAGQTPFGAGPELALIGFRDMVNRLWAVDEADDEARILVWTLDLGRQDFDDLESRLKFMNVESLTSRFAALRRLHERVTEARWNWLQSGTVIVLHDTRSGRPEVPRLPAFDPHHVLFSATPPRWASTREFHRLYGIERLHETSYSIFLRKSDQKALPRGHLSSEISSPVHHGYQLRYFGDALLPDEKGSRQARSLQLIEPGRSYTEALGTVFVAATRTLGFRNIPTVLSIDAMTIDPDHAIEKLRHHGFLLLRLEEFMRFLRRATAVGLRGQAPLTCERLTLYIGFWSPCETEQKQKLPKAKVG
jgi:hypothetical protein